MSKLPVIEIFGPTIQGEGAVIGLKTMFVRLYGCDYHCRWCDSSFTWDGSGKSEVSKLGIGDTIARLDRLGLASCEYVTISGGNPALYGDPVKQLIEELQRRGKKLIVETQGSLWQDWFPLVDLLTISPKPPSSGMSTDWAVLDSIMDRVDPSRCSLKVVVFDDADFRYAKRIHEQYPAFPMYLQPGNSDVHHPGDISSGLLRKLEWLFQKVLQDDTMNDVRTLPQLHALVWNNERKK